MGLVVAAALVGCGRTPAPPGELAGGARPAPRVVALAPGAAEMLALLGLADRVVGVGDFVDWPPALAERPRVGAYNAPNQEQILHLEADLLVTSRSDAAGAALRHLEELGVEVLELDLDDFQGVFDGLTALGERFERRREAARLAAEMRARLASVTAAAADAPRRRVLVVVGRDPLYVAGPGSHLDKMIDLAGGRNVAHDAQATYQLVSLEAVLERLPEVIVDTSDNRAGALRGRRAGPWSQWSFLPAVRDRRVYFVDPERLSIPGPRLPEMAELMGRLIHPEIFGEPAEEEYGALTPPA